jgi:uncharacterized protein YlxP (DUF503 family)
MTVGIARMTLFIPASHSLKDKRMVLRRLKAEVRDKFNAAIAEVGDHDLWQRAALGVTVVGHPRAFAEASLDEVIRFVQARAEDRAEVTQVERELQTFSDAFGAGSGTTPWPGGGD